VKAGEGRSMDKKRTLLRNINTDDFYLEECDLRISCSVNPFEFSRQLLPERLNRLDFLNKITQVIQV
jgi:hypothetical protein